MPKKDVKKVVLAYSGGLDTSIILKWLQQTYGCEVVTFTADLGQGEELEPARAKALLLGIKPENIFIEDLREEFVRDYVFPMFRANALYEGQYLLGTSIARPLIAKKQIEIAERVGADAVAHGATGKGNDQVRFELTYYALKPDVTVIAPWREWDLTSRTKLIEFAEQHQIPIAKDKSGEAPFSVDANLLHASSEGKVLEDPAQEVPDYVYSRTGDPEAAPDKAEYVTVEFARGDAAGINGKALTSGGVADGIEPAGPRARHRPARPGGEPLRRHEIPRHVRNPRRHDPLRRASGDRADHARPRRRASQGRADAALQRADLQRLLVHARARDAAGGDRQIAGIRHRDGAPQALQGERRGGRAREQILALRPGSGDIRGGRGGVRPPRRRRVHPAERAAPAHARPAPPQAQARPLSARGLRRISARRPSRRPTARRSGSA